MRPPLLSLGWAASLLFGPATYRGPRARKSLALTFDDGPTPSTAALANMLAEAGARATFFVCGANVARHPEIVRALHAAGHEIGNHTFSHRRLCPRFGWQLNLLSPAQVYDEFARAQDLIVRTTGVTPTLMRAPYGLRWFGMSAAARRLGLRAIQWTSIAHDWEWTAGYVARHVVNTSVPGGIVCLHDGRETRPDPDIGVTYHALRQLLPRLRRQGYSLETVSELLLSAAGDKQRAAEPARHLTRTDPAQHHTRSNV